MQQGLGIVNEWSRGAGLSAAPARHQPGRRRRHRLRAAWRLRRSRCRRPRPMSTRSGAGRRVPRAHAGAPAVAAVATASPASSSTPARCSAQVVVNAAGPWAKPLAESAGLDLPLRSVREQDTVWQVPAGPRGAEDLGLDGRRCLLLPAARREPLHHRARLPEGLLSTSIPTTTKPAPTRISSPTSRTRVERRFPAFAGMRLIEAYAALYDVTPDWYPFVGPRAGSPATRTSPAAAGTASRSHRRSARELADWLLTGKVADDFRQFSHDRIARAACSCNPSAATEADGRCGRWRCSRSKACGAASAASTALDGADLAVEPGRDHRADRAERRRQDHAVQRRHRRAAAERRRGAPSTAHDVTGWRPDRLAGVGPLAHLPDRARARAAHRDREPDAVRQAPAGRDVLRRGAAHDGGARARGGAARSARSRSRASSTCSTSATTARSISPAGRRSCSSSAAR